MTIDLKSNSHGKYAEDETRDRHPSYAQLSFGRQQGGRSNLYGSSIQHQNKIVMRVYPSEKIRDLYQTSYHNDGRPYIEVEMSQTQFAEAITSMNIGGGVPVTLTYLDGKQIEPCPETHTRQLFECEFKAKMQRTFSDVEEDFAKLTGLMNGKETIKASDRKGVVEMLRRIQTNLTSNMPFLQSSFNQALDKTVLEAKGEIEAFYEHKIHSLGLQAAIDKGLIDFPTPEISMDSAENGLDEPINIE